MLLLLAWGRVTQAEVTLDGTLGPSGPLAGPHYPIPAEVGHQVGSNLFHSFGKFSVNTGESATFSGPESIDNVIGRVTGGDASWIDGTLRNQIPSADLYLLNPAGIMFGSNAHLDVDGSFHASTADYVRLDDGGRFDARDPSQSILTAASPAAFGFLEENPNGISLERSALTVDAGKTLSLVGGDIDIVGDPNKTSLSAPGGRINIASVASSGEVIPNAVQEGADVQMNAFAQQGEIRLSEAAELNAGGDGGGTIVIRGGRFIADNSAVQASVKGPMDEFQAANPGEGIDIEVTGSVGLTNGAQLHANTYGAKRAGDIEVTARALMLSNGSTIGSNSEESASGQGGDVTLTTVDSIEMGGRDKEGNASAINVDTHGSGDGGTLSISTSTLTMKDSAMTAKGFGEGNVGNIVVAANQVG